MRTSRLLPALALGAALLQSAGSLAQPPGAQPVRPVVADPLPVVPKSAGAFVTLKVSDLVAHPDLKPLLTHLAKEPDALAGITEAIGVSPLEIERVTLFWPRASANADDPVLVITTREPFNEARVLKALRARPVYENDGGRTNSGSATFKGVGPQITPFTPPPASSKGGVKSAEPFPNPKQATEPQSPKGDPPRSPFDPPKENEEDDLCAPSGDGGPSDPLFYAPERGPFDALFLIDDRTLVFLPNGPRSEFAGMALLAATLKKNATGPLADAIAEASKHTLAAVST